LNVQRGDSLREFLLPEGGSVLGARLEPLVDTGVALVSPVADQMEVHVEPLDDRVVLLVVERSVGWSLGSNIRNRNLSILVLVKRLLVWLIGHSLLAPLLRRRLDPKLLRRLNPKLLLRLHCLVLPILNWLLHINLRSLAVNPRSETLNPLDLIEAR
jgi:hypothetical protein